MNENAKQQAAKIFLYAASYIRKYGWQEKGMSMHGKPRCSMGAIESAGTNIKWDETLAKLMYETLYRQLNGITLTEFNKRAQDGNKVALLFEHTAIALK